MVSGHGHTTLPDGTIVYSHHCVQYIEGGICNWYSPNMDLGMTMPNPTLIGVVLYMPVVFHYS